MTADSPSNDRTGDNPNASSDRGELFVGLLVEHEPQTRAFLRGLLPTWGDVDEVIQEASLVAWRKFDDFELGTAFGGWFLTIARFEALKHRRKIAKSPLVFSDEVWEILAEDDPDRQANHRTHLQQCLAKLKPNQRSVLLHVHSPGVVMNAVAKQSGKSEAAFYKLIQRLRTVLLNCVQQSMATENQ